MRRQTRKIVKIMLLAIDVGNTQTVIGVYAGDALRAHVAHRHQSEAHTADELRMKSSARCLASEGLDLADVRGVGGRLGGARS